MEPTPAAMLPQNSAARPWMPFRLLPCAANRAASAAPPFNARCRLPGPAGRMEGSAKGLGSVATNS
jgi:hypothetical protein